MSQQLALFASIHMTLDEALAHGRHQLSPTSPSPQLDARLLLQHVLGQSHAYLISHNRQTLTAVQQAQYQQLLQRASQQEPIPYLIGTAPFFEFELNVSPAVLIPRPETEQLVETAVRWANTQSSPVRAADIGSGSGAIAIALARQLPQAQIQAVDISADALAVAQKNADRLAPQRIQFYQGDLLRPLAPGLHLIVANLPYITDDEWADLAPSVKQEPVLALKAGPDGLDLIRQLLAQAPQKLAPGGAIFLEIGWQQATAVSQLAAAQFPNGRCQQLTDFAGHDRIVAVYT